MLFLLLNAILRISVIHLPVSCLGSAALSFTSFGGNTAVSWPFWWPPERSRNYFLPFFASLQASFHGFSDCSLRKMETGYSKRQDVSGEAVFPRVSEKHCRHLFDI